MNIIEAVKSGKRFRRIGWTRWYPDDTVGNNIVDETPSCSKEDILATDWEIEERKVEITESEFENAYKLCESSYNPGPNDFYNRLKRGLFNITEKGEG
jgi:hypothetical protein